MNTKNILKKWKQNRYLEACWNNPEIDYTDYPDWEKRMDVVKEQLLRVYILPMQTKVIRTNLLGENLSQVYDSEMDYDARKVIRKKMTVMSRKYKQIAKVLEENGIEAKPL